MGLVTDAIVCLLDGVGVKALTIGFDNEAQVRPVEVDAVAVDVLPGERDGEGGLERDRDEEALQLGVGQAEGVAGQELSEDRYPGPSWCTV